MRSTRDGSALAYAALALSAVTLVLGTMAAIWPAFAEAVLSIDQALYIAIRGTGERPPGPPELVEVIRDITALGGYVVTSLVVGVTVLALILTGRRREAAFVAATVISGMIAVALLKALFARPRPDLFEHAAYVASLSLPSGHAAKAALTYLTVALVVGEAAHHRPIRVVVVALAVGLVILIGLSRIYLGVHWPTDVVAGWMLGVLWVMWACVIYLKSGARRKITG